MTAPAAAKPRQRRKDIPCTEGCGTLTSGRGSGRCRTCANWVLNTDPAIRQRRAEAVRRAYAADPSLALRAADLTRRHMARPERRQQASDGAKERRLWEHGVAAARQPAALARRSRTISEQRMAWCPPELRDEARRLVRSKKMRAAEVREMILSQHARDMARFRAKLEKKQ